MFSAFDSNVVVAILVVAVATVAVALQTARRVNFIRFFDFLFASVVASFSVCLIVSYLSRSSRTK